MRLLETYVTSFLNADELCSILLVFLHSLLILLLLSVSYMWEYRSSFFANVEGSLVY